MNIIYKNKSIAFNEKNCIALGNFDGVHIGHQSIIKASVDYALNNSALSCVYTFSEHPSYILGNSKPLLTTNEEKCKLFEKLGCNNVYFDDFSSVRNLTPQEFCKNIIVDTLNASAVFCGENYHFGRHGSGNTDILKDELCKYGVKLFVMPYKYYGETIISSSEIRNALTSSETEKANNMLGRKFSISGKVLHGKKLGRKLGFPTLNIDIPDRKVVPAYGVYYSICEMDNKKYFGITNIGIRPTTDGIKSAKENCETYLFNYEEDAYGKDITVSLCDKMRSETKFNSTDELKKQVEEDIKLGKAYFNLLYGENI